MSFLFLACGALTVLAAGAAYTFSRRTARTTNDQVSSNWLATARIHEDLE